MLISGHINFGLSSTHSFAECKFLMCMFVCNVMILDLYLSCVSHVLGEYLNTSSILTRILKKLKILGLILVDRVS